MSQLSTFLEQSLNNSIRNNKVKTTQNAVKTAYEFTSKLPINTLLDIIASDIRFAEMHSYMCNIIAYNLSIKLVELSDSDTVKNLVNDGYLIDTSKEAENVEHSEPVKVEHSEPVKVEHSEPVKVEHSEPVKVLLCKTVKPNTSIPKKTLSWSDDDDDEAFEREQLAKLEKEKLDFEQYKSNILKNNTDWSMKVMIANAKTKDEINNILQHAEDLKAEQAKAEQTKAEQAKAEQAKAEQAKAEQAKAEQVKAEQIPIIKSTTPKVTMPKVTMPKVTMPKVTMPVMQKTEKKLDSRFYTRPPIITNKNNLNVNNPSNIKYNKNPERLKTVTSSRFFMDGDKKYNKVPEDQDWYAWDYDTETMMPYGWRKVGTFPDKFATSADSPYTLINNDDGTWSVQETYSVEDENGKIRTITEYITIEYYIWCLTPPYYRKTMKQPAAN